MFCIFFPKPRQDLSWLQLWHQRRKANQLNVSRLCNLNPLHHRQRIQVWTCSRQQLSWPVSPSRIYRRHRNMHQHFMSTNQRHTWWRWRETHLYLTHRTISLYQASQKRIRSHNLLNQQDRQWVLKFRNHYFSPRQQPELVHQKRKKKWMRWSIIIEAYFVA